MTDARRSQRRRVLKGARIVLGGRFGTIPCTIKDLSERGCRIKLDRSVALTSEFRLLIELDGVEFDCVLVWRSAHAIGVAFKGAHREVQPTRSQVVTRRIEHLSPGPRKFRKGDDAP